MNKRRNLTLKKNKIENQRRNRNERDRIDS